MFLKIIINGVLIWTVFVTSLWAATSDTIEFLAFASGALTLEITQDSADLRVAHDLSLGGISNEKIGQVKITAIECDGFSLTLSADPPTATGNLSFLVKHNGISYEGLPVIGTDKAVEYQIRLLSGGSGTLGTSLPSELSSGTYFTPKVTGFVIDFLPPGGAGAQDATATIDYLIDLEIEVNNGFAAVLLLGDYQSVLSLFLIDL